MPLLELVTLALVQGITEFLPISSSAHLILVPLVTGWPDQGLDIDIAVHVGTLAAVVVFCRDDVVRIVRGVLRLPYDRASQDARLAINVIVASVPIVVAGLAGKDLVAGLLRSPEVIAWATIGFGVLLYAADRMALRLYDLGELRAGHALAIGCAQVLALIPGTSRSGITMTMARALGFDRRVAARFSFLISIPTIAGAGLLGGLDVYQSGDWNFGRDALIAVVLAFVAALATMALLMRWVERHSFAPFVVYRLALGAVLLIWLYS